MDKLSPEILCLIIAELSVKASPADSPRLGAYATISRRWQHLIETRTFASIRYLKLDEKDLSSFASLFADARRQTLLRDLCLTFEPPVQGNLRAGHIANSAALGHAFTSLFKFLSTWEIDSRTIKILFHVAYSNYTPSRRYFMLDQPETVLAAVPYVSYLRISGICGMALHPTAAVKLAGALPNLHTLDYRFYNPEPKRPQLRKEIRKALATSLEALELPMLRCLELTQEPRLLLCNHSLAYGDLRDDDGVDLLSTAILKFTQRTPLQRLILNDFLISSELFTGGDPRSTWPTLQHFDITGGPVAPSGEWYWTGDPTTIEPGSTRGYGSDADSSIELSSDSDISWHRDRDDSGTEDDSDRDAIRNGYRPMYEWRDKPDWDMLAPLLVNMARAVQRMPNLQRGRIQLRNGAIGDVSLQCAAPGFRFPNFDKNEPKSVRKCRFFVGEPADKSTWFSLEQIPGEVRSAWRGWLGSDGEMETGR